MAYEAVGKLAPVYLFWLTSFTLSEAPVLDDFWFSEAIMMLLASEPCICSSCLLTWSRQFPVYCVKLPSGLLLLESMRQRGSTAFLLLCKVLSLPHTCYGNHDVHCECLFRSLFYQYTVLLSSWCNDSKWCLGKIGIPDNQSFFCVLFLKLYVLDCGCTCLYVHIARLGKWKSWYSP